MSFDHETFPELPKSWVSITVEDACINISIREKILTKSYLSKGNLAVVDQGYMLVGGFTDQIEKAVNIELPVIIFGDHTRVIKFVDFPFAAGADGIKILKPNPYFLPKLFYWFLKAIKLPDKGYARHFQYLRTSRVALPPLNEQKRIADKLDRLLSQIDACRKRCDHIPLILKCFRQSVLAAAISGELTEDWRSDRFNDSDFDLHSVAGKLGDFAEVIDPNPSHRYPSYDAGIVPLLATEQMSGLNDWNLSTAKLTNFDFYQSRKLSHDFFNDDIIFARKGRLGLARKPPQNCRYVFSHTVFIVRAKINKILPTYLLWFLRQEWCIDWLLREMNSNTGVPTLGKSFMIRLPIQVPSEPEQQEIVRRVEKLFAFADRLESRYQTARKKCDQLTPALLEKAFQGELVPQDPNDEPASELLARILAERQDKPAPKRGRRTTGKRSTGQLNLEGV